MNRSNAVAPLLACCLLLTIIGVVRATGCVPDPETGICMTTDRTAYNPGDAVIVTVDVTMPPNTPTVTASIAIYPVPPSPCGLSCAVVWGNLTLYPVAAEVWGGTVAIRLPDSVKAGNYEVQVFGPAWAPYAGTEITITSQASVPESSSVLGLLLPALLTGIYVMKRKKRTR